MRMKWLFIWIFYLSFVKLSFSQNKDVLQDRLQKECEIVLLKNENDIIPIQKLDTVKLGVVIIGGSHYPKFIKRLESYTDFHATYLSDEKSVITNKNSLESANLFIVAHYSSEIDLTVKKYLDSLSQFKKVIAVSFLGNAFLKGSGFVENKQGVLQAYEDTEITQDYAAQVLFGGIGAKGKLKEGVSELLPAGFGIETNANRLKYTIPEELGINSDTLYNKVEAILNRGLEEKAFPGVQVMAIKDGKVFFHESYGYHTYDSVQPVLKNDIYDLASVTKVTASTLALMKLHDQGKFDLDEPASVYWEPFKRGNKKSLTFRSILSHNAQLKSWIPYWTTTTKKNGGYRNKTLAVTKSDNYPFCLGDSLYLYKDYKDGIYDMIRKSPLNEKRGYVYSGLSFYLYPEIVKTLSRQRFEEFLDSNFYSPLGAESMLFNAALKYPLEKIIPTEVDTFFRKRKLHGVVHDEGAAMMQGVSGNAGLFGSAEDLAKVWQMFLNGGVYGGEKYLSEQTIDKFTSCQYCETGNRRGLGFDKPLIIYDAAKSSVSPLASSKSYGHSGYTGTFVWADPENDFIFIFLSNRVYPTRNNRKIYELNIRPEIHHIFYGLFND